MYIILIFDMSDCQSWFRIVRDGAEAIY